MTLERDVHTPSTEEASAARRSLPRKPNPPPKLHWDLQPVGAPRGPRSRSRLEATCITDEIQPLASLLGERVLGQDDAVDSLVCALSRPLSGLRDPHRPHLTSLLLGPTGVGKTETVKTVAEALFGNEKALTRIDCEEYAHGHEVAKLLGSPPGYVGHQVEPLLSQDRIDAAHRQVLQGEEGDEAASPLLHRMHRVQKEGYVSVLLFDEVEKAHPALWNALLGILEDGVLTLGNNTTVDFTGSLIFLTSNVGSREMGEVLSGPSLGFGRSESPKETPPRDELERVAREAAEKRFPLELLNRFDETLVYSALDRPDLEKIFDKFLGEIHDRSVRQAGFPLLIQLSPEARDFVLAQGTDLRFGARPLRRAVEKQLVDPLSRLMASRQLKPGDLVDVEVEDGELVFFREEYAETQEERSSS